MFKEPNLDSHDYFTQKFDSLNLQELKELQSDLQQFLDNYNFWIYENVHENALNGMTLGVGIGIIGVFVAAVSYPQLSNSNSPAYIALLVLAFSLIELASGFLGLELGMLYTILDNNCFNQAAYEKRCQDAFYLAAQALSTKTKEMLTDKSFIQVDSKHYLQSCQDIEKALKVVKQRIYQANPEPGESVNSGPKEQRHPLAISASPS